MATDNKISTLLESQVPGYLLEEGPNLVAFLKAYYEWMETSGQVTDASKNLLVNRDIDTADLDKFYEYFRREVLADFPSSVLADRRLVAKRIKDLYRAKGSTAAYNLLFRILYDQDVSIYKPSDNILRASDGRWTEQTLIRLGAPTVGNLEDMVGLEVTGRSSGAKGTVISVLTVFESGIEVKQLRLKDVDGVFKDLEIVETTTGISGQVVNSVGPLVDVLLSANGITGGTGHQVGDKVSFISSRGTGANGTVITTVDPGAITSVSVDNGGSLYNSTFSVSIKNLTRTANNGIGDPLLSGVVTQAGRYTGTKGFLSWDQRLQDNYYYQEFSYVVKSQKALKTYRNIVRDVIHPAGTKLFGQIDLETTADLTGLDIEGVVSTDLIGGKFGISSIGPDTVFGTPALIGSIVVPSITSTTTVGILEAGDQTDVYLNANGFIYVANSNIIAPYLTKPITDYLDDPVLIGTSFVVVGDGAEDFTTILAGGSEVEIQDVTPGTSGNTSYIVNTVFSNTTFSLNTEFTGAAMSNGIFRYTYNGNI